LFIGDFENSLKKPELFKIVLNFLVDDFKKDWRRCNLVSNYIAEYSGTNFKHEDQIENLISTISNEMIESLFPLSKDNTNIRISFKNLKDDMMFEIENVIKEDNMELYKNILENINNGNVDSQYIECLNNSYSEENNIRLSFLMIANDYDGKISSKIDNDNVVTKVLIGKEEITK
jgi:hypothetical protein